MNRATWYLGALLLIISVVLCGCLELVSVEQPSSLLPGELFTIRIAATADGGREQPYFGICLPRGWTIPGDAFSYTGVHQGTISYDPKRSLEQENLGPAPEGYYWWVGDGDSVDTPGGAVFAEVPIQAGLRTGRYSLDYLLATTPYGLTDAVRSDDHIIEVVNEFTPSEILGTDPVYGTPLSPQHNQEKRRFRGRECGGLSTHSEPLSRTRRMQRECCLVREFGLLRDWRSLRGVGPSGSKITRARNQKRPGTGG